jgi:hypothetical protein
MSAGLSRPIELGTYRVMQGDSHAWCASVVVLRDVEHWFLFTSAGRTERGEPYSVFLQPSLSSPEVLMRFRFAGTESPEAASRSLDQDGIAYNHIIANLSRRAGRRWGGASAKTGA